MCLFIVPCPLLNNPNNGIISCSLGDDNVTSYEDTCNFTCNTGYELTGSDTRTCQSDGSWSGTDDICRKGDYIRTSCRLAVVHTYIQMYMHVHTHTLMCVHLVSLYS